MVHVSITNPSEDFCSRYFSGKARLERALVESGLSYAILRPAVLFGKEDSILVNNMAWALRHLPVFGVFGDGQYKLQSARKRRQAQQEITSALHGRFPPDVTVGVAANALNAALWDYPLEWELRTGSDRA